jgi:hypothetical protein
VHIQKKLLLGLLFRKLDLPVLSLWASSGIILLNRDDAGFASLLLACCACPQGKVILFVVDVLSWRFICDTLETGLTTAFLFAVMHILKIERLHQSLKFGLLWPSTEPRLLSLRRHADKFLCLARAQQDSSTFYPSDVLRPAAVGMPWKYSFLREYRHVSCRKDIVYGTRNYWLVLSTILT